MTWIDGLAVSSISWADFCPIIQWTVALKMVLGSQNWPNGLGAEKSAVFHFIAMTMVNKIRAPVALLPISMGYIHIISQPIKQSSTTASIVGTSSVDFCSNN
jgi:hypothetical protein